jgi:hypothetical protein
MRTGKGQFGFGGAILDQGQFLMSVFQKKVNPYQYYFGSNKVDRVKMRLHFSHAPNRSEGAFPVRLAG